jgi:hypothetical protein
MPNAKPWGQPQVVYRVEIPGWHPASVNELFKSVKSRIRLKKRDRKWIGDFFGPMGSKVPLASGKRRVSITIVLAPGQRGKDVDAYHKSPLDALKYHGLIRNDTDRWCEITPVNYDRAAKMATVFLLEDLCE